MEIQIIQLSYQEVLDLLKKMSPEFSPPLSNTLNLEVYADKLAKNAKILVCHENSLVKGTIVFYTNTITSMIYIPLVWVNNNYRGLGLAKKMFDMLIHYGQNLGVSSIDLEVLTYNIPAKKLYESLGFYIQEERGEKNLMRKKI